MYTADEIKKLDYTDFIAFIKETNRCPGGKSTIRKVLINTFLNSDSRVLDVGSNTGFNTFEIARMSNAKVTGIDVSESCVNESIEQLNKETDFIQKNTEFLVGSAYEIPFKDNEFNLVFTGGATSFMNDKRKAVNEYLRVAKDWGYICMTPLVYIKDPPGDILSSVGEAIGTKIQKMTTDDWIDIVLSSDAKLELFYKEECEFTNDYHQRVDAYIEYFMAKLHIQPLDMETKDAIREKWLNYISIFAENHNYLGFVILIFRKRLDIEEPELFTAKN